MLSSSIFSNLGFNRASLHSSGSNNLPLARAERNSQHLIFQQNAKRTVQSIGVRVEIGMNKDGTLQFYLINLYESFQIFLNLFGLHSVPLACMQFH